MFNLMCHMTPILLLYFLLLLQKSNLTSSIFQKILSFQVKMEGQLFVGTPCMLFSTFQNNVKIYYSFPVLFTEYRKNSSISI